MLVMLPMAVPCVFYSHTCSDVRVTFGWTYESSDQRQNRLRRSVVRIAVHAVQLETAQALCRSDTELQFLL